MYNDTKWRTRSKPFRHRSYKRRRLIVANRYRDAPKAVILHYGYYTINALFRSTRRVDARHSRRVSGERLGKVR